MAAIQWKRAFDSSVGTDQNANGSVVELITSAQKLNTVKSVSISNGNGGIDVLFDLWIDTSSLDTSSPEYTTSEVWLIRQVEIGAKQTYSIPIDHATWSSNGSTLKCRIKAVTTSNGGSSNSTGYWWRGSIILSGSNTNFLDFKIS